MASSALENGVLSTLLEPVKRLQGPGRGRRALGGSWKRWGEHLGS